MKSVPPFSVKVMCLIVFKIEVKRRARRRKRRREEEPAPPSDVVPKSAPSKNKRVGFCGVFPKERKKGKKSGEWANGRKTNTTQKQKQK